MQTTKIEWATMVWNPVTGCSPVSAGCQNCYARRRAQRMRGRFGYPADDPFRVTLHPDRLDQPFRKRKPQRIFVCSMGDLFHPDVPFEFIDEVFTVMALCPQHTFCILTKRPERMGEYANRVAESKRHDAVNQAVFDAVNAIHGGFATWPLANVWLGVSVEDQKTADERIPLLLKCPAALRFVSCEPLLGTVDIWKHFGYRIDKEGAVRWCKDGPPFVDGKSDRRVEWPTAIRWVIVGGETGPGARRMEVEWVRGIRDQCVAAQVPFFFKRFGPKQGGGRVLDGQTWDQVPDAR